VRSLLNREQDSKAFQFGPNTLPFYEINTWVWLSEMSQKYGVIVDLFSVPSAEWDAIAALWIRCPVAMGTKSCSYEKENYPHRSWRLQRFDSAKKQATTRSRASAIRTSRLSSSSFEIDRIVNTNARGALREGI
jgi:hypothetical protein